MSDIPVREDPLPAGFHRWDSSKQQQYLEEELDPRDYIEIVCYHADIPMKQFQEENPIPTEKQMEWIVKLILHAGEM